VTYLLDTNVLSETRKRQPVAGVADWIAATPQDRLNVSVLTLGEIEQGIARVRDRGDRRQASALERWLRDVETGFEDRVLPGDSRGCRCLGPPAVRAAAPGAQPLRWVSLQAYCAAELPLLAVSRPAASTLSSGSQRSGTRARGA
jgi:toxin FitB